MRGPGRGQGGGGLLLFLGVFSLMGILALAAVRNVLREGLIAFDALQGAQASVAADSGVLWILTRLRAERTLPPGEAFQAPPGGGCLRLPGPAGGTFGFSVRGTLQGPMPGPLCGPEGEEAFLWKVEVQGHAWRAGGSLQAPDGSSKREAWLELRGGGSGPVRVRLRACRPVW